MSSGKLQILHLEDDPNDAELIKNALNEGNICCEITRVDSKELFLAAIKSKVWDIILSDYKLNGFSGTWALEETIKHCPKVPFIFVSGLMGEELAVESLKLGATDYVIKDRLTRLVPVINRALLDVQKKRELEAAQAKLTEKETQYRELVDSVRSIILRFNKDGKITFFNKFAQQFFGYSEEEILGKPVVGTIVPKTDTSGRDLELMINDIIANPEKYIINENENIKKTGERVLVAWTNKPVITNGGTIEILSVGFDITEKKKAEMELKEFERRLAHAQKMESLAVMAAGIAHDFNNLLMVILGHADLLLMDLDAASPLRDNVNQIVTAARRAAKLVQQMLVYSGQSAMNFKPVHVGKLVKDSLPMLEALIGRPGMLVYEEQKDAQLEVNGDADMLRQMITNLVLNAAESMEGRNGKIQISTGLMYCSEKFFSSAIFGLNAKAGSYVFINIKDEGCGMTRDVMARIFDPFFTTKFMGRGLGLPSALGIIQGHNGFIRVESEPDKGSLFQVLLPVLNVGASAEIREDHLPEHTIMIIDDDRSVLDVVRRTLERSGYGVICANSGEEGIELLKQKTHRIDLVILDYAMPKMNGEETLMHLKVIKPDVKVILATGFNEGSIAQRFSAWGLSGFITKPFQTQELIELVKKTLLQPVI